MRDLGEAERFVVWSFRRWVLGLRHNDGGHWDFVRYEFEKQLGAVDGRQALASFARLIWGLQCHARRPVCHHQPCCAQLGADEVWLVSVVAACQLRRDQLAGNLIEWMVAADGADGLREAGTRLGELMRDHALCVPLRADAVSRGSSATWGDMASDQAPRLRSTAPNAPERIHTIKLDRMTVQSNRDPL